MARLGKRSYYMKKGGRLFRKYIRTRGKCEAAGQIEGFYASCGGPLQCAHIKSVGAYPNLQFDPMNALCLCFRHHMMFWHRETGDAWDWFKKAFPNRYQYLLQNKNKLWKPSRQDLKDLCKMYEKKIEA